MTFLLAVQAGLAEILAIAALFKLRAGPPQNSVFLQILPLRFQISAWKSLAFLELSLGIAFWFAHSELFLITTTALLYSSFWIYSLYALLLGVKGECACFGHLMRDQWSWPIAARNTILGGLAWLLVAVFLEAPGTLDASLQDKILASSVALSFLGAYAIARMGYHNLRPRQRDAVRVRPSLNSGEPLRWKVSG